MQTSLIVEDYPPMMLMLKAALQSAFPSINVDEATTLADAYDLMNGKNYNLALIDINLPDGSGLDLVTHIKSTKPQVLCIMATVFDDDDNLFKALSNGADGYIIKDESQSKLAEHLQGIVRGEPALSAGITRRLIKQFQTKEPQSPAPTEELTSREKQVLTHIAQGLQRKEIARELNLSVHTVSDHTKVIYRKLKVSSKVEATKVAINLGLLK